MTHEIYEVWDLESGNVLAAYPTEQEALELVRLNLGDHGPEAVRQWALIRERRGRSVLLGQGDALIQRALGDMPARQRRSRAAS